MLPRRQLLSMLAASVPNLDKFLQSSRGAAVLLDVRSRRVIGKHGDAAGPPGSTLKPFVLAALLRSGKLAPAESLSCPGNLTIAGRSFACSHPRLDIPMRVDMAIAYSCNYFVAHVAERFGAGELARELVRVGLPSAAGHGDVRLQALGEGGGVVTVAELATAYRRLALEAPAIVLAGLEGAVDYGTAQRAAVAGVKVAGKTGSVLAESGAYIAWFAGFMPSRNPEVVVTVMLQGRSGGSDAAPVAGQILAAQRALASAGTVRVNGADLPLERYVAGVLAGESSVFRSEAALRAMAVAARTYGVRERGRHAAEGYDFCSTTHCQRVDLDGITPRLEAMAAATEGEMLWFEGKPALTLYTQDCGGRTEQGSEPYLKSRVDPSCGREDWQWDGDPARIAKALAAAGLRTPQPIYRITILDRTASGRARTLSLGDSVTVSAGSFRFAIGRAIGWNTVRSDLYEIQPAGGHILFQGRGSGHGIGLCQRGADQMGRQGKSYRDILAFYYPGTAVGVTARGFAWQQLSGEGLTLWTTHPDRDGEVLAMAVREARTAAGQTGWPLPAGVEIRLYPDLDSYRNATGEPGSVAAYSQGRRIHVQPAAAVRGTLRHEIYHVLVESQARPGLPLWFREEVVKFLAGEPNSVAHYGEATLLDWVKNSSANVPATKSR